MASKIIMTVPDGLSLQEEHDLRHLFADALHEFAGKRADAGGYVRDRYPAYEESWAEKAAQVARRVQLARKVHGPSISFEVEHVSASTSRCSNPRCIAGHNYPQQTEDADGPSSGPCLECSA